jgi:hypothetical protein
MMLPRRFFVGSPQKPQLGFGQTISPSDGLIRVGTVDVGGAPDPSIEPQNRHLTAAALMVSAQ